MADPSLFTDGQVAALATALGGGLALIGGAVRQGFRGYAAAFREMTESFKAAVGKLTSQTEALIRLEGVVEEGRADIGEIKSVILNVLSRLRLRDDGDSVHESGEHSRPIQTPRRTARIKTPAPGVPIRRANTDADR